MKKFNWKKLIIEVIKLALAFFAGSEVTDGTQILSIGLGTAAVIGAGASLLGTAGSAISQGKLNRKTRKWNEKMWHLQNQYNLPEAQMQRFKDAGLNPHLIFGQGSAGNAGSPSSWTPTAPDLSGVGGAVGKYFATQISQGQVERIKTENAILATQLDSAEIDLDVKKKLSNVMVPDSATDAGMSSRNMLYEGALSGLQEKRYRADRERIANVIDSKAMEARVSSITSQALNEAARTGLINAQTANTLNDAQLKQLDAKLMEYEVQFLDSFNVRRDDAMKMLTQSIPFIIRSLFGRSR